VDRDEGFLGIISDYIFAFFATTNYYVFVVMGNGHAVNFTLILMQNIAVNNTLLSFLLAYVVLVDLPAVICVGQNQNLFPIVEKFEVDDPFA
jgi:hypothetical protein